MGESALSSHAAGSTHKTALRKSKAVPTLVNFVERLVTSTPTPCTPATTSTIATSSKQSIITGVPREDTLKAEVLWCLNMMESHYSFNSSGGTGALFSAMFPDSAIAKTFACGATKSMYICTHGLAPHFKHLLCKKLSSDREDYVLLFDESLNRKTQSKQCDFHVRLWDGDKVVTRFYDSKFMGHATALDLKSVYERSTENLPKENMVQISMDGPNVNWSFYSKVDKSLQDTHNVHLINIGSCGLHIAHGAFLKGVEGTDWKVGSILQSMHHLLRDSPARREDYFNITGSGSPKPLKFCRTRWLENVPVLERALEVLPHMAAYVNAVKEKRCPNPGTKSFDVIQEAVEDPLMAAKLNFILSVSKEVTPFLACYQTDKPMVPFLSTDLFKLLKSLMCRCIKKDIMKKATTPHKLLDVEVGDQDCQVDSSQVDLGFVTGRILRDVSTLKTVGQKTLLLFKHTCKKCLVLTVQKFIEKSPLKYPLVSQLSFLDPRDMACKDAGVGITKFRKALTYLVHVHRVNEEDCDELIRLYSQFIEEIVLPQSSQFSHFDPYTDRVDTFLHDRMSTQKPYEKLWRLCRQLLLLSHGQASVERGFSINRQIEDDNLSEDSYVAQRCISDHLRAVGGTKNVTIDKQLLMSVGGARQRYITHLEDTRRKRDDAEKQNKRKYVLDEIDELKMKKKRLKDDMDALESSADKLALEAEKTGKLTLIAKSNSLRKGAKEKRAEMVEVEKSLDEKLNELKSK